ncbi:hypothetical protein SDJN02_04817, partial [Cucurbita argyrosperma subsp. argyrosperma]
MSEKEIYSRIVVLLSLNVLAKSCRIPLETRTAGKVRKMATRFSQRRVAHVDSLETKTEGSEGHQRVHHTRRRDMMGIVSGPLLRVKQGERRANMGLTPSWWNSTPLLHLSTSTGQKVSSPLPASKWCIQPH